MRLILFGTLLLVVGVVFFSFNQIENKGQISDQGQEHALIEEMEGY